MCESVKGMKWLVGRDKTMADTWDSDYHGNPEQRKREAACKSDVSRIRRYLEIVQWENRGGNHRKHPVEGERERSAQEGLRAIWQLEYALERIEKAQSLQKERRRGKR